MLCAHPHEEQHGHGEQGSGYDVCDGGSGEIQQAAQHGSEHHRQVKGRRVERHGAVEARRRYEVDDDGLTRRHEECTRGAEEGEDAEHRQHTLAAEHRESEQQQAAQHRDNVAQHDDASPVIAIGDLSGEQHERDERRELCEADESEIEQAPRDRIDLPADRDALYLRGDVSEKAGAEKQSEVGVA
jgi:hypothetical protein